ncbi:MAG: coenzyme F420 hydrogenase [Gemmatimonadales bacterium]|nr:MAG: coenzyme F420 hydrogenase [Gemmatimonadales bacterium]
MAYPLAEPVHRDLCTDCGISRTSDPHRCGTACQFIRPRYAELEAQVHGRSRDPNRPDELHFGPFLRLARARLRSPLPGAQWTGITTRIGERLLEEGLVDAVLATAAHPDDRWRPRPVLVTEAGGMKSCRGMKMGYSPILALLDEVERQGIRRLAVVGIPCQVHALRALQETLELDELRVVGTPCSDNTTTDNFHHFLAKLSDRPDEITYLEFRADYHVEVRFRDGEVREIPFLQLPLSELPQDFFPLTCRSCVDYVNVLSDLTVGYMGGDGDQWLIIRNERGREMVELLGEELALEEPTSRGRRKGAVQSFMKAVQRSADGLPLRKMPSWARPIVGRLMPLLGPAGTEFARTRVEMKAVESIIQLRRHHPRRIKRMIPSHVWDLASPYGLQPEPEERS